MRLFLLLAALGGLATPPPLLGFVDVPKLTKLCSGDSAETPADRGICLGYVAGAVDQLMAQQAVLPAPVRTVCLPEGATLDDAVVVVRLYAARAGEAPGVGAAGLVKLAMEGAYPCGPAPRPSISPCKTPSPGPGAFPSRPARCKPAP